MRVVNGTPVEDLAGSGLVTRQRIVIPVWASTLGLVLSGTWRRLVWLAVWVSRAWIVTVPAALVAASWLRFGRWAGLAAVVLVVLVLVGWRMLRPASFSSVVVQRLRGWVRWHVRYARAWHAGMDGVGLTRTSPARIVYTPRVDRIRSTKIVDVLDWRLLHGQTPAEVALAAEGLRHVFAAHRTTVAETGPGRVRVTFYARDVLRERVPRIDPAAVPDLEALPVARLEDGEWFRLRLAGTHVLVAGATDAGKGSVLWSVLHALAPAIHAGTVRVTGIDPKGMELYIGTGLFTRLSDDATEDMVAELEAAAERMQERKAKVKAAGRRKFVPSVAEPFELIVIDELAYLTAYTIPALRKRVEAALSVLLSQGRAPGYSVLGLVQDPRKDTVNLRNLFPVRIALRLAEESEVDMVLGDGSADRGARCHEIPLSLPGVGYVRIDGSPEPRRIRFPFHDDDDIRAMAHQWAATGPERTADVITLPATRPTDTRRVIPMQRNDSHSIDTDRPAGQEG